MANGVMLLYKRGIIQMTILLDGIKRFIKFVDKSALLSGIMILVISGVVGYIFGLFALPERVGKIEDRLEAYETENEESIDQIKDEVRDLYKTLPGTQINITVTPEMKEKINDTLNYKSPTLMDRPPFETYDILRDSNSGYEFTFDEWIGKRIVIPYSEGDQKVYFCGQYNAKNQWDGECLVNVYHNNELIMISETNYIDGKRESYKNVFSDCKGEEQVWNVSNRICFEDYNYGETREYRYTDKMINIIDDNDLMEEQLITYDQFIEKMSNPLLSYYHGNTSDGKYNDDTGDAYLIKYEEDGTVRTLYQGKFRDGAFDDSSGNAWYITRNPKREDANHYMYYKGKFFGGSPDDEKEEFINPIYQNEINKKIEGFEFNSPLEWNECANEETME